MKEDGDKKQPYSWKVVKMEKRYSSPYLTVFEDEISLPSKQIIHYSRVELSDFVTTMPLIDDETLVMIQVFRYPLNQLSLEFPSGHIKDNESPEEGALRELKEETGYRSEHLVSLGWYYPLMNMSRHRGHLFLSRGKIQERQTLEETEFIEPCLLSIDEVYRKIRDGYIKHAPTIIAFYRGKQYMEENGGV